MNALALVVGNANYNIPQFKLDNPVNDANSLGEKLLKLGFTVKIVSDCDIENLGIEYDYFIKELDKYDCGLFFFAGHGCQVEGINYLTATDLIVTSIYSIKRTSLSLDEVLNGMQQSAAKLNILIIDACRDNPLPANSRSLKRGLANVNIAQGTIIAFSTSPNSTAMDSGIGNNSIYTGALLNHLNDSNIEIEEFFKRVRMTVFNLTNKTQEPWCHISFGGNFSLNSGHLIHSVDLPYGDEFVADKNFVSTGSRVDGVIEGFKTHNWDNQNRSFNTLCAIPIRDLDKNRLFLIGRNILQTAIGNAFECINFILKLTLNLGRYNIDGENHLLNGILFEIYFNSEGKFRETNFKSGLIDEIFILQTNAIYKSSFDFINKQLQPFRECLFYIPSTNPISVPIEIIFEEFEWEMFSSTRTSYRIKSLKYKTLELLEAYEIGRYSKYETYAYFIKILQGQLAVPSNLLRISSNFDLATKTDSLVFMPSDFEISKKHKA